MKRHIFGIVTLMLLLCLLSRNAIMPERFTGLWYGAKDGRLYRFQEGIIECIQPESPQGLDGAYSFTRSTITLFVSDLDDLDTVRTLYWISSKNGTYLCENAKGDGSIYFSRTRIDK